MRVVNFLSGMVLAVAWISILLFTLWVATASAASNDNPGKGKAIFTQSCASCHGLAGKGDGAAAAALNPKPANLTDKAVMSKLDDAALTKVITKGGTALGKSPLMPAFSQLKDQDVKDLISYIRSLAK